ncbi:MAG: DUF4388 domain-containing protein, partial [Chitinivibrionales bacterium]|nr:DUF4388 domain-containing protein [Chitinivibrionales bacterium]MBD3356341.1 DUF4388 domain-containing protein [Chitinivibrionales bacterium]
MILDHLGIVIAGALPGLLVGGALAMILGKRPQREDGSDMKSTSFVFSGNLRQTNLLEAVQFLEIGRREGILHIYTGRRKGYLIFSQGKVIDAFFRDKTGREGILSMLALDEGDFYFEPKSIRQPKLIAESIMDIAFEWNELQADDDT